MLYYLNQFKDLFFPFNLLTYITFRAGGAILTALVFTLYLGPSFIRWIRNKQLTQNIRKDGPPEHLIKSGTPTMGGVFIIGSILISVLLWGNLTNSYILMTFFICLCLAILGGIDDYIKLKGIGK